jgi:ribosomal-protein-alanine N-acetyltransferase
VILPGEVNLRPAVPADIMQVERIERDCFNNPWPRSALMAELEPDLMRVPLVAEIEDRVVGYLMAWQVVDQLHILNIAVFSPERRRGIGSLLLTEALTTASASGLKEASLEVRQSNIAAQEFYRHHGFVAVGKRPRYYPDSGEDALIMTRRLSEN